MHSALSQKVRQTLIIDSNHLVIFVCQLSRAVRISPDKATLGGRWNGALDVFKILTIHPTFE